MARKKLQIEYDQKYLQDKIDNEGWNMADVAEELGISITTLYSRNKTGEINLKFLIGSPKKYHFKITNK